MLLRGFTSGIADKDTGATAADIAVNLCLSGYHHQTPRAATSYGREWTSDTGTSSGMTADSPACGPRAGHAIVL
jgi:hypothetical protein